MDPRDINGLPIWARDNPILSRIWLDIECFIIKAESLGADKELAKARVIYMMQHEFMTFDNAQEFVIAEISSGTFK